MHKSSLRESLKRTLALLLIGVLYHSAASAQSKEARLNPSKDQILARAKQEGKLSLVPGYDKSTIGPLVAVFNKKYPFIEVSWQMVTGIAASQRQLFELAAGKAAVDVFSPSTAFTSEYFKQDLIMKYELKGMAKSAQLKIPIEMIDESGSVAWLGSNVGVFAYNSKLVPADKAPRRWDQCVEPQWKGKIAVDTKPSVLAWLVPTWGEEKVLGFARNLKANDPRWVRGQTGSLALMAAGEFVVNCDMYLHTSSRALKRDPTMPIKVVVPEDVVAVSYHEPEAIYGRAQHPHAGLLWMEFIASPEGQTLVDAYDPGKASFVADGTLAGKVMQGRKVSRCNAVCRNHEDKIIERIAVEGWGLPKAGVRPK